MATSRAGGWRSVVTMKPAIRPLILADFDAVLALWKSTEGVGLGPSDSREGVRVFLRRNPGLSLVAEARGEIIGTVLCGHDGRRGFLYHLAVASSQRRRGLARELVQRCLAALAARGIQRCHIVVFTHNLDGQAFWKHLGWERRDNLLLMSKHPAS